ncbi:MAG: AAA family ATPase, partial [Chloroflexi bacterium]|nr:AAA family ATPase [Chloroflexota bacterium]
DDLYRRCDPAGLAFETTAEVPPADGTVGQDRALSSLAFGLEIQADGYNLFVAGPAGTGRNSTLRAIVSRIAAGRAVSPDWSYVHNFQDGRQPSVISLPAGRGRALARDMDAFVDACRREIPRHFESESYIQRRDELSRELQGQRERAFEEVEQEARRAGFSVNVSPMGVATVPLKEDGQPMSREEFAQLPEERRRTLQASGDELQSRISQAMLQARRLEKAAQGRLEELNKTVALYAITPLLNELRQEYLDVPKVVEHFALVEDDIIGHLELFRPSEQEAPALPFLRPPAEDFFARYKVNVVVAQQDGAGAPVVIEHNPTYYNLFGRVDYRSQFGAVSTDHTMIKAGSIHRANGGYLILQVSDVLTPLVYETLKRTLRCREIRIENLGEQYSAIPVATLNPQPVPLDVKVVLVGNPLIYHQLYRLDEEFRKLFRVKADFTTDMDRSDAGIDMYSGFISSRVREERLRHFDRTAVARVVEYGSRLVEHQGKLSTRFIDIGDLLTEADFWAGKGASDLVRAEHVERAIEEKVYRSNLLEERVHELIEDGTVLIDTQAAVVGQVNGISVYELGDYRFGRPSRITARVSLGRGQVVSIDREIQLSGRLHNKGFAIVNGYLHGKYAQERPLSLTASIGFEQTYDEVEGDSASAAELYALLSALADAPVKQGIAVTGSVNQRGEVQPIGAVNDKIEGFYAVCKARGLTGEQGVVIPKANVQHLMLKREVVDACRAGRFHVWVVSNVDEGIEVLTGVPAGAPGGRGRYPAGTINRLVTDRLAQMSRRVAAAGRTRRRAGQPAESENDSQQERQAPDA